MSTVCRSVHGWQAATLHTAKFKSQVASVCAFHLGPQEHEMLTSGGTATTTTMPFACLEHQGYSNGPTVINEGVV